MILEANNDLESKIITIGYGSNESDFEKLKEEVAKRVKAKKVFITRGGSICSNRTRNFSYKFFKLVNK